MSSLWRPSAEVECEIVPRLDTRPSRWTRLPIRAYLDMPCRPNESSMEMDDGSLDTVQRGEDRRDQVLEITRIDRASAEALEELSRRNIPCYVYPAVPGTSLEHVPFNLTDNGDPVAGAYTGGMASTVQAAYLTGSDAAYGAYPALLDTAAPVPVDGIWSGSVHKPFPMGRGVLFLDNGHYNWITNARFGAVTGNEPSGFDWNGTPGVDGGVITTGWLGVAALWMYGTTSRWLTPNAGTFACTAKQKGLLQFYFRTDGVIRATFTWSDTTTTTTNTTALSGLHSFAVTVPAGCTTWTLQWQLASGTWGEICLPCIYGFSTGGSWNVGGVITGANTAAVAQPVNHLWSGAVELGPFRQSKPLLAVGGYWQPLFGSVSVGPSMTLAQLLQSRNAHDQRYYVRNLNDGNGLLLAVSQNGTEDATAAFPLGHALGDTYAWLAWAGWTAADGTWKYGLSLCRCGDTNVATASVANGISIDPYCHFDTLRIGGTGTNHQSACGIIGAVSAFSLGYDDLSTQLQAMAQAVHYDMWRTTLGRLYRLNAQLRPRKWSRTYWTGIINCTEVDRV